MVSVLVKPADLGAHIDDDKHRYNPFVEDGYYCRHTGHSRRRQCCNSLVGESFSLIEADPGGLYCRHDDLHAQPIHHAVTPPHPSHQCTTAPFFISSSDSCRRSSGSSMCKAILLFLRSIGGLLVGRLVSLSRSASCSSLYKSRARG